MTRLGLSKGKKFKFDFFLQIKNARVHVGGEFPLYVVVHRGAHKVYSTPTQIVDTEQVRAVVRRTGASTPALLAARTDVQQCLHPHHVRMRKVIWDHVLQFRCSLFKKKEVFLPKVQSRVLVTCNARPCLSGAV